MWLLEYIFEGWENRLLSLEPEPGGEKGELFLCQFFMDTSTIIVLTKPLIELFQTYCYTLSFIITPRSKSKSIPNT